MHSNAVAQHTHTIYSFRLPKQHALAIAFHQRLYLYKPTTPICENLQCAASSHTVELQAMTLPTRIIASLWRFILAGFSIAGTLEFWWMHNTTKLVYFTFQTNLLLAFVMIWAGCATLLDGIQPPAWLKGLVTLNIIITGLVAWLVLPPTDPNTAVFLFGMMTATMVHVISPIMATVDFVLFDEHRRFPWHYALSWLIYFPVYLIFVLVRAHIAPHSGPGNGGNPYPYGFIDLQALGWTQLGINIVVYLAIFALLAGLLVGIDHILPQATPLTATARLGKLNKRTSSKNR